MLTLYAIVLALQLYTSKELTLHVIVLALQLYTSKEFRHTYLLLRACYYR